ncbi:CYTH domain-containing protein [Granulicatella adiacens]|uniref:CYTH domain-containing protein n=1 Tax=Granulicatella adiacens TaxID=46124 RepID=UPI003C7044F1
MLQVEREFKNLLTKSQYHSLLEDFKPLLTKEITQTNSYFDWDGILQSHKMALRIRIVEGKSIGEITLKIPQSTLEVLEFTHEMPVEILHQYNEQKQFSLPLSIKEALESNGVFIEMVKQTALLTTHRFEGPLSNNEWLVLDESYYNGKVDYEMEMEVQNLSLGEEVFLQILQKYQIQREQAESKIKRALSSLSS